MLLKLRKPVLKYTLNKYYVNWLSSLKHLKLPISIEIPVTKWQIVYIYMTAISSLAVSCIVVMRTLAYSEYPDEMRHLIKYTLFAKTKLDLRDLYYGPTENALRQTRRKNPLVLMAFQKLDRNTVT